MGVLGFIQGIREGNQRNRALAESEHRTDVAQSLAVLQAIQAQQNREQMLSADISDAQAHINQALVNESMLGTSLNRAREMGDKQAIETALAQYDGARMTREGLQSSLNSLRGQRDVSRAQTGQLMDFMAKHTLLQDVVTQTAPLIQQLRNPQNAQGQSEDQMGQQPPPAVQEPTPSTTPGSEAAPQKQRTPTTIETAQELQGDQATIQPALKDGRLSIESTQPPIQQFDEKGRVIGEQQVPPSFVSPEGLPVPPDQFAKNLATLANAGPSTQDAAQRDLYGASVQYLDALTQTGDVQRAAEGNGFVRNRYGPNAVEVSKAQTELQRIGSAGQGNKNFMNLLREPTPGEAAAQLRDALSGMSTEVPGASPASMSPDAEAARMTAEAQAIDFANYLNAFVGAGGKLPKNLSSQVASQLLIHAPFPGQHGAGATLSPKAAQRIAEKLQPEDAKRLLAVAKRR